ncbi:MAG TPA: hypothetical protein VMU75_01145 [Acidimicrobiales bacterium]|nr:hypothetical protein [Acidimicrobiales bacterium]
MIDFATVTGSVYVPGHTTTVSPGDAAVTAAPIVVKAAVVQEFVVGAPVVTGATDVVGVAGGATYKVAPEELLVPPSPPWW